MTFPSAVHVDARLASEPALAWAVEHLRRALAQREISIDERAAGAVKIATGLGQDPAALTAAKAAGVVLPGAPESMALLPVGSGILAWGRDQRGLVYALTELADRVAHAEADLFGPDLPLVEEPSARVRSIARLFSSEAEDKSWFHDRQFWHEYLSMLASNRFNRFNLTLGMGYNYPYHNNYITDVYFYFPYPFLLDMPEYGIDVKELTPEERDANLETLKFIARETARRGLDFHLALWTQRYDFDDVPNAWHTVRGVTDDNLAPYCRDALTRLLTEVPEIKGITFRVHVEGGIAEGDYGFWKEAFAGIAAAGRPVEIDMHGKGLDHETIAIARASGMPIAASPKYMAEHMGLPIPPVGNPRKGIPAASRPQPTRAAQRGLTEVSALQLRRPAAQGEGLEGCLPHLAGNPAGADVGRSSDGGRLWPVLDLLRRGRRRIAGAQLLEGTHGHRHSRPALPLSEAGPRTEMGLAEARVPVPRLGPPALLSRCAARQLDAAPSFGVRRCGRCLRDGLVARQSRPAIGQSDAWAVCFKQPLLAGGLLEFAGLACRHKTPLWSRHGRAGSLWQRADVRSSAICYTARACRGAPCRPDRPALYAAGRR